jgi:hypothetical protein
VVVELWGTEMEEKSEHVATSGDQLDREELWLETGGSFGDRVDEKGETRRLAQQLPVFGQGKSPTTW